MSACALGVKHCCRYSYVTFVDADDELPISALETMAEYCSETYNIIIGRCDDNNYPICELTKNENRSCAITRTIIRCESWGRLIKHSLFDNWVINIPRKIVKGEDILMNIRLVFKNQRPVKLINKKVYNYFSDNKNSIMNTFKSTIEYEEIFSKHRLLSIPLEFREYYIVVL